MRSFLAALALCLLTFGLTGCDAPVEPSKPAGTGGVPVSPAPVSHPDASKDTGGKMDGPAPKDAGGKMDGPAPAPSAPTPPVTPDKPVDGPKS